MNTEREKPLRTNRVEDTAMNGLPVTYKTAVWHIGELEPLLSKRTGLSGSDEGPGISVSECPDDWRQIARLGGSLWQLSRTDGEDGKFIDFHELTPAQRSEYTATALRKRLIKECTMWQVFQGGDEHGEARESFKSREEAERELTYCGGSIIEEYVDYEAMTELDAWWQQYFTRSFDECHSAAGPGQLAILKLMMDEGHHDGVWWYDNYDPLGLSAPRGVIFPTRLNEWQRRCEDDILDPSGGFDPPLFS